MNLQDRAYAVAIFIVIGICCIGAYVAVTGFMNSNPEGLSLGSSSGTPSPTLESAVQIPTETAAPPTTTSLPTEPPTPTPKGFVPPGTPTIKRPPTLDLPTAVVTELATETPLATLVVGCGYPYCGRIGVADPKMAPTGRDCPTDYLWGAVYDKTGKGISGWEIRYQQFGGVQDHTITKGPPDTRIGGYDIPVGAGTWTLQLFNPNGDTESAPFQVKSRQPYSGGSACSSRVDFVEQ